MRKSLRNSASLMVIAMALAAGVPKAQAGLVIEYSLNGGATFTTLASGASGTTLIAGSPAVTLGHFRVSDVSVMSDSPGSAALADIVSATLDIKNISSATRSIEFIMSDTGFTAPTAPPILRMDSHIGGSVTVDNSHNLMSFTSCLSTTNTNLTSCAGATYVDGPGTPIVTASSFDNNQFRYLSSLTGPYSITEVLDLTLGAGSDLGFQANTALEPIPEPVSLSLLGAALLGLGLMRRAAQVTSACSRSSFDFSEA